MLTIITWILLALLACLIILQFLARPTKGKRKTRSVNLWDRNRDESLHDEIVRMQRNYSWTVVDVIVTKWYISGEYSYAAEAIIITESEETV